jgi:hypothetical protein
LGAADSDCTRTQSVVVIRPDAHDGRQQKLVTPRFANGGGGIRRCGVVGRAGLRILVSAVQSRPCPPPLRAGNPENPAGFPPFCFSLSGHVWPVPARLVTTRIETTRETVSRRDCACQNRHLRFRSPPPDSGWVLALVRCMIVTVRSGRIVPRLLQVEAAAEGPDHSHAAAASGSSAPHRGFPRTDNGVPVDHGLYLAYALNRR